MDVITTERARRLELQGAANFRDLGGYVTVSDRVTRWGRMWRSDSLADLTETDLATLETLGLHSLIDFRLPQERARKPNRLPSSGAPIRTVEIGFIPRGAVQMLRAVAAGTMGPADVEREVAEHYRRLPLEHNQEYAQMLDRVEEAAGAPVLIHCASGKDRTGWGAAVLLLALGVPRATVEQDYALTNQYRRDIGHVVSEQTPRAVVETLTAARPQYLVRAFQAIDETYGSDVAYLERGLGLSAARRARFEEMLTTPA
ncbi:MAG: tyrosine-protein phosphatase [Acetobacteraceae bacterium]|nr:tyrosine-protein phosphatase [Acetobacteraceae bacterium]